MKCRYEVIVINCTILLIVYYSFILQIKLTLRVALHQIVGYKGLILYIFYNFLVENLTSCILHTRYIGT